MGGSGSGRMEVGVEGREAVLLLVVVWAVWCGRGCGDECSMTIWQFLPAMVVRMRVRVRVRVRMQASDSAGQAEPGGASSWSVTDARRSLQCVLFS